MMADGPTVAELLRQRARERSTPGARTDGHHLALVIEGGGMRGVVSGGMVTALESLSLLDCFDTIHGSSAGACAGAYFMAGQAKLGTSIYFEDINNKQFIDVARGARFAPIMNTAFLIDHVMRTIKPLDVPAILKQPGRLHMVTTDIDRCEAFDVDRFEDEADFFAVLKASISIPLIAGSWRNVRGRRLVDGGMMQQIALESAAAVGASHVLVLMTHRQHELLRPIRKTFDPAGLLMRAVYGGRMTRLYSERMQKINRIAEAILSGRYQSIQVAHVARPSTSVFVDRLTTDAALLRQADEQAQQAVRDFIDTAM